MFIGLLKHEFVLPEILSRESGDLQHDVTCQIHERNHTRVCYEGILYNKKELGFEEVVHDAEVIAMIYERQNYQGFSKLDGAFTFIITTPTLTLIARDHHGTGTQVYYTGNVFASSLSLLQQAGDFQTIPNTEALATFLSTGYIPTPSSAFVGVKKLGAGEILLVENERQTSKSLFPTDDIQPASTRKDIQELAEEYGTLHSAAIRRRIGTHRNVGILLSGGYDSGGNLAALRKIYTGDIHSFSIGFKGDHWSELPLARCMSERFSTIHHEYEIDGSEIKALPEIIKYLGDPFVEGGLMVNYAAMHVTGDTPPEVILGGDGSDQYFGTSGREIAIHYLASKYGMKRGLQILLHALSCPAVERHASLYKTYFHLDKIIHITQGDRFGFPAFQLKQILQDDRILQEPPFHPGTGSFNALYTRHVYETDIEKTINQVILFKASKMATLFNNHLTFPYMDLSLYNFLMQIPVAYKCKGNSVIDIAKGHQISKYLLKYHYKPLLPEQITGRKKQGGFAPMPIFFKEAKQRASIADFILQSSLTREYLKKEAVEAFIKQYDQEAGQSQKWFWYQQNKAIQYFNLFTLAIWWEFYVKKNSHITL